MSSWVRLKLADGTVKSFDIHPVPTGRAPLIERIVRHDNVVIGAGKNGALYGINGVPTNRVSYGFAGFHFIGPMAKCIYALKLISKEDMEASIAADVAYQLRRDTEYKVREVLKDFQKLELKLTKGQVAKLNKRLKSVGSNEHVGVKK